MNLTELLVMGYDGDKPVFASHLTATNAATILAGTDIDGETAIEAVASHAATVYSSMVKTMEELVAVSD